MSEQPTDIAVRDETGADAYERDYMKGQGAILHRTKRPAPRWLQLLLGFSTFAGIGALFTPAWIAGLAMIPIGFLSWVLFSVLRCTVSEGSVNVQYGPFGPTIPTAAIQSADAVDYDWKKFGGWGIRRALDGTWMYNMPGDNGRALKLEWTDAKGRKKTTMVGMPNPEPAATAVRQAMQALPPAPDPNALGPGADGDDAT